MHPITLTCRKSRVRTALTWAVAVAIALGPVSPWADAVASDTRTSSVDDEGIPATGQTALTSAPRTTAFGASGGVCRTARQAAAIGAAQDDLPVVQPSRPGAWRQALKMADPSPWIPGSRAGHAISPGPLPEEHRTAGRWLPGYRPNTLESWDEFRRWQQLQGAGNPGATITTQAPAGTPGANLLAGGVSTGTVANDEISYVVHDDRYPGSVVDVREVALEPERPRPPREPSGYDPHTGLTWEEYRLLKEQAQSGPGNPDAQVAEEPMVDAPGGFGVTFDAIQSNLFSVPPDPIMTAGPNHLIGVVNSRYQVWDKSGNALTPDIAIDNLFFPDPNCTGNFDVYVDYDEAEDRFILGAMTLDGGDSYICIAATTTNDPTTTWHTFSFRSDAQVTTQRMDYPHTAIGFDAVYIGANMFADSGGFTEARLYALDKNDLYTGDPLAVAEAGLGGAVFAPQPAKIRGFFSGGWPPPGTPHYIVATTFGTTRVYEWENPLVQAPTLFGTVDDFFGGAPPNAPELDDPGADNLNDTAGGAWLDAEYRNGFVWAPRSVNCNIGGGATEACIDWIRIDVTGGSPVLAEQQTGGAYGTAGGFRYYPDGAVDKNDNFAVGYTHSSATEYTSVRVTGRESGDPAGELQTESVQRAGLGNYTDGAGCNGTCDRWGDYSGMAIDPDGCTFWYIGEFSDGAPAANWNTSIGSYRFPGCSVDSGIELAKGTYTCSESFTVNVVDSIRIDATTVASQTVIATGSDSETVPSSAWIGSDCVGSVCGEWTAVLPTSSAAGANNDGTLNVSDGDTITVDYTDPHPGHASPSRNAAVGCTTRFDDGGFLIFGGCEAGTGTEQYRDYLDAGELIDYEFGLFYPVTAPPLTDVQVGLSISGPASGLLTVFNPTVTIGAVEPGTLTSAVFHIAVDPGVDTGALRLTLHDFDFSVTSPADGYVVPQVINQQQYVQADDNIVTFSECFNFESGDQGWIQDNYTFSYTCAPPDCPAPRTVNTVAAPWTDGSGCGSETRSDYPEMSCDVNGTNAFMSNTDPGACNNFAQGNNSLTDDIIYSPILTPMNTGNAGNGQPWFFQLTRAEWFYNSDMEDALQNVAAAWAHFWSTDYQGVATPAQNEVDTLYDFFLGFFFYPDQVWDSGTAWNASNPPANYDAVTFPSSASGLASPGVQFRWAVEMLDADFGGDPTATAATTGVVYDDLNFVYDQYHVQEQVGVCGSALATVSFEQLTYQTCPGSFDLGVLDGDAVGPLTVTVTSSGTGDSETVSVSGAGPNFTGALSYSTSGGEIAGDGTLFVTPDDTVQVSYDDASPVGTALNTAFIDCPGGNVTVAGVTGLQDDGNGDGDAFADTNETIDLSFAIRNDTNADLTNVTAFITSADPNIDCISKSSASFGTIAGGGGTASNDLLNDAFTFKVANSAECVDPANPPTATFNVFIVAEGFAGPSSPQTLTLSLDLNESGSTITFTENFDSGPGGFTHTVGPGDDDGVDGLIGAGGVECGNYGDEFFHRATGGNPGGAFLCFTDQLASFPSSTYSPELDSVLTSPTFTVDSTSTVLTFDHEYKFADNGSLRADGARVDYRVNGGAWQKVGGLAYDGPLIFNTYCNPLCNGGDDLSGAAPPSTRDCFHETANNGEDIFNILNNLTQNWTTDTDTITGLTPGDQVQFRWRVGTMNAGQFGLDITGGYGVDNVSVTNVRELVCDGAVNPDTGCNVVFSDADNLTEVCGDGDGNVEPTEIWDVDVTLRKLGAGDAVNTMADLQVNAGSTVLATVSGNPQSYGTIAGNGGTASATYQFEVDAAAPCLENATFDVANISDTSTAYPDNLSVFNVGVGSVAATETGNQQTNPASAAGGTGSAVLTPAFGLASPVTSASLSYAFVYDGDQSEAANQSADISSIQNGSSTATLTPAFTILGGNATAATVDWTALSYAGQGNLNNCTTVFLVTPDATEIDLKAQGDPPANPYDILSIYQGPNGGPGQYSIGLNERQGGGCNGSASLSGTVMSVDGSAPGDFTTSARVSLFDGTTSHILKDFGVADGNPYDVTSIYDAAGPGTYEIRVEESGGGGTARVSSAVLTVETGSCDLGCLAGPSPPPVASGITGTGITVGKGVGPDDVVVNFDNATCSDDHAVVLYGDFGNFTGYQGAVATGCDAGSGPSATFTQSGSFWFILHWVSTGGAAGSPGDATSGQRTWSATGLCGVTSDDPSDPVCN